MAKKTHVLLAVVLMTFANTSAWDGQRKGFIWGIGLGPGFTQSVSFSGNSETSDRKGKFGLASDFRIGYVPSKEAFGTKISSNAFAVVVTVNVLGY